MLGSLDTLILEDICKKGYCHIPGLGTFGIKEQKPHAICNISTGLLTQTKPSVALTFKSAATLRQGLNSFHLENE